MTTMAFSQRRITGTQTTGEYLRLRRQEVGYTLATAATLLQIRVEYVQAIESADYSHLPGEIFVKNYVKKYCKLLQIPYTSIAQKFEEELNVYQQIQSIPTTQRHLERPALRIKTIFLASSIVVLALGVVSYIVYEVTQITQPPMLSVDAVPVQVEFNQSVITVSGHTASGAEVLINDQPVAVDETGAFSAEVTLRTGLNTITVVARTKRSRDNTQYQRIYKKSTS